MRIWGGLSVGLILLALSASSAGGADAKRVLMVHSFGSTAPPFTTHSTAFETALTEEMGKRIDLDEVSLDMARYAQPDMEESFVEFLLKRLAKWQPDLVVPVGAPAGRFVAKYRERLFPETPIIYMGMDRRTLPPGALRTKATFVGEDIDLAGIVEDMLQLAPDTNHIAVVLGASQLERYWTGELRRAVEPFTKRVSFTWLNDLSFDEMLGRVAKLPPRSFIFLGLLLRDAAGVTHNEDDALKSLHAVANAPINGVYQNQLGLGIVGGRLYQAEAQGVEAARVAVRILRGEPVSNFPPQMIGPGNPRYDWRELQRWGISEARLPPGSDVRYRRPTLWEQYRWEIIATLGLMISLALVVAALLFERRRRQRAQTALEDRLRFETLLTEISAGFAHPPSGVLRQPDRTPRPANSVDEQVREGLRRIAEWLGAEGACLWRFSTIGASVAVSWTQEGFSPPPAQLSLDDCPFLWTRVIRGETLQFRSLDELPPEANVDRQSFVRHGVRSWVAVPLEVGGAGSRVNAGLTLRNGKAWPDDVVQRLRTVGEMFAGALARAQAEAALSESEARFRSMADTAPVLIWMAGLDQGRTFFNKGWLDFTGRTMPKELGSGWVEGVHPEDVDRCLDTYVSAFERRQPVSMEYRLRRHDGEYRTIVDKSVPRFAPDGTFLGYIGCGDDITERKRAEEQPRQVLEAAPNAMIMVNQDGRITLVNAAAETVFGYAREELIGSAVEVLVPERFRPHHPGDRRNYFANPGVRMMGAGRELYGRRKDGSAVPVEIGLTPIQVPEGLFVLASVIDITARKAAELETQQHRTELAHVARISTMGQLATALAHELNQPLTAILANAQTVQEWLASPSPDLAEVRETMDDIVAEDIRASEVIRRMRGLLKKGEPRSDAIDVNALIREVTRLIANDALLRGASIECDLSPALPRVRGDAIQFQQVLLNLLVNGLHAVAEEPPPRRRVIVRTAIRDGGVEVSVQDTGKGIAESDLQQIFVPFYSTKGEGLGVGLSISRSIVETYGGRIWAENGADGGAIFRVRLPARSTATGPPEHPADLPG